MALIVFPNVISATPASLTFTADNWDQGQPVTVSAETDDNDVNAWAVIAHQIVGVESYSTFEKVLRVVVED